MVLLLQSGSLDNNEQVCIPGSQNLIFVWCIRIDMLREQSGNISGLLLFKLMHLKSHGGKSMVAVKVFQEGHCSLKVSCFK